MKIAHLTAFFPPKIGGMERCVYSLVKEQVKQGNDVFVFTSDFPKLIDKATVVDESGGKIYRLKSFRVWGSPFTPSLAEELCKYKFDIIHGHIFHFYYPEIGIFISKLRGTPFVSHIHFDPEPPNAFVLQRLYKRISAHVVINLSNAVIAPSISYKDIINFKYGRRNEVFVIPYGVNSSFFLASSKSKREPLEVLFVGRISYQKGLDLLIQAMRKIINLVPQAKLTIVGPIDDVSEQRYINSLYKMITKLKLNDHILLVGSLTGSRLIETFNRASVFVVPSRFESFGIVLLEAMASRIPVVASEIPVFHEVAGSAALLVEPTPEKLAKAIVKLFFNEKLRNLLVSRGEERARKYTWERSNKEVMSVYNKCIHGN